MTDLRTSHAVPGATSTTGRTVQFPAPLAPDSATGLSQSSVVKISTILTSLRTRSSPSDPRYYEDKVWYDGSPTCSRCTVGPSVLSAVYGTSTGDRASVKIAIESLDHAIAIHQRYDGAFGPPGPGEGGPDIQTVMYGVELAQAYLILGRNLDAVHRRQWALAITKAADFLIRNGNLTFYINGNINLSETVLMDLAHRITRLSRFASAYERSYAFTVTPPQDGRWKGFGLQYSVQPTEDSGADGAGYLAEAGADGPGYDPAYSIFQADIASAWFLLTSRPEALQLTNMLQNQLWSRVRTSDWTIDVGGGTRRSTPGVRYRYYASALPVLALKGGRDDLVPMVAPQLKSALTEYGSAATYISPGFSFNFGGELGMSIRALTTTPGW